MNDMNIRLLGAHVPYTELLPAQLVHIVLWNAQLGVQMFFAIAGFLITSITIRRRGSLPRVSLRGFYLFRFARIAPLLFLLLAVLCTLQRPDHSLLGKHCICAGSRTFKVLERRRLS
jgi:peptidoglycan/LPS O-acetylase OafA/YrhL